MPEVFGRYRLLDSIGRGGMAEVFLAKLEGIEGFERRLALKRIHPQFTTNASFVQMFIDEARLVGHFNHPNVVQMFDFGKVDDTYYIAMEFIEGTNVAELMSRTKKSGQRLPIEAIVEIGIQLCQGMDYAHKETDAEGNPLNIIHRDLTPHNILISRKGTVKITDFGIAKASMNTHMTQAGMIKGKVPYMSPEQAMGLALDNRSDIFSIGINLFEMCTLRRLFDGPSDFHVLQKVMAADIPALQTLNPDVPPELEKVIRKALAQNRDDRYASAGDMGRDLNRIKFTLGEQFSNFRLADYVGTFVDTRDAEKAQAPRAPVADKKPASGATPAPQKPAPTPAAQPQRPTPTPSAQPSRQPPPPRPAGQDEELKTVMISAAPPAAQQAAARPPASPVAATQVITVKPGQGDPDDTVEVPPGKGSDPNAQSARVREPEPMAPTVLERKAPEAAAATAPAAAPNRKLPIILAVVVVLLGVVGGLLWKQSRPGTLVIEPVPNKATIYVGGQKVADGGPISLPDLAAGKPIQVKVEMKGFKPLEQEVTLRPGETRNLKLNLEMMPQSYGFLVLSSDPPGARVLLGGAETGWVTPCRLSLAPGQEYTVTLNKEGRQSVTQTFKVEEGKELSATLPLPPVQ